MITLEVQTAESTARAFTAEGCRSLIRASEARLREIDALDLQFGERGAESRAAGRIMAHEKLARARAALAIRLERDEFHARDRADARDAAAQV